jgi:hypothetical protein
MKKALLIGTFSLLTIAPLRCAQVQADMNAPAVRAVEKSSAGNVVQLSREGAVGHLASIKFNL